MFVVTIEMNIFPCLISSPSLLNDCWEGKHSFYSFSSRVLKKMFEVWKVIILFFFSFNQENAVSFRNIFPIQKCIYTFFICSFGSVLSFYIKIFWWSSDNGTCLIFFWKSKHVINFLQTLPDSINAISYKNINNADGIQYSSIFMHMLKFLEELFFISVSFRC